MTKTNEFPNQQGLDAPFVSGSFSLKYSKEKLIRHEMDNLENLIVFLESKEFKKRYNISYLWYNNLISELIIRSKKQLRFNAKKLSENYR